MKRIDPHLREGNDIALNRGNVILFRRPALPVDPTRAFNTLTHRLVMEKYCRGELEPAVIAALLAGVGVAP